VIELPECLTPRGVYNLPAVLDDDGPNYAEMNGQVCHRIAFHSGHCLFDRPAEFTPPRMEARPLPKPMSVDTYLKMGRTWRET
jgi:hypothetical protein